MEHFTYLFQEEDDARTWGFVVARTPAHQDHELELHRDKLHKIYQDCEEELGQYKLIGVTQAEAQRMFESYDDILKTRDLAEDPELHKNPRAEDLESV